MKKIHIIWAVVAVFALAAGYLWGKASAGSAQAAFTGNGGGYAAGGGRRFGGGSANGQTFAAGQIASMDATSITLQLPNGNSEVVFYSSSTEVTKPSTIPISALSVGSNVVIDGIQNSDGSMTASSIQERPAGITGANAGSGAAGQ